MCSLQRGSACDHLLAYCLMQTLYVYMYIFHHQPTDIIIFNPQSHAHRHYVGLKVLSLSLLTLPNRHLQLKRPRTGYP